MLLYILLIVLAAGKLRGGQVTNLAQLKIRHKWLLFTALLAQVVAIIFRPQLSGFDALLFILSYLGLLIFCLYNLYLPGMKLVMAGVFLNFLVITVNGGAMPISLENLEAIGRGHQAVAAPAQAGSGGAATQIVQAGKDSIGASPNLGFLGDVIVLPLPFKLATALSVGDVVLTVGLSWLILQTMFKRSGPEIIPGVPQKVVIE
jgi:hypothetical protein